MIEKQISPRRVGSCGPSYHDRRKTTTPTTRRRWARGKTDWDVAGRREKQMKQKKEKKKKARTIPTQPISSIERGWVIRRACLMDAQRSAWIRGRSIGCYLQRP